MAPQRGRNLSTDQRFTGVVDQLAGPAAPIYGLDEVFADPGVQHLDMVADAGGLSVGSMRLLRGAINIRGYRQPSYRPAPLLGQQTRTVLLGVGYDDESIDAFEASNTVCANAFTS